MPPLTLPDLLRLEIFVRELAASTVLLADHYTLPMRERLGTELGEQLGRLYVRYPREARRVLQACERLGVRGAGWALVALDLDEVVR